MGYISKDTFKRLFLLYTLGEFRRGSYGLKRLHKIAHFIHKESTLLPFTFERRYYGQYSEDLEEIKDQLISMGYVAVTPLNTGQGNRYILASRARKNYFGLLLGSIKGVKDTIERIVEDWGYRSDSEILEKAYNYQEVREAKENEVILDSNLPAQIELRGVNDGECDELELSLNPRFIASMDKIVTGLEESDFDIDKVKRVTRFLE